MLTFETQIMCRVLMQVMSMRLNRFVLADISVQMKSGQRYRQERNKSKCQDVILGRSHLRTIQQYGLRGSTPYVRELSETVFCPSEFAWLHCVRVHR